MQATIEDAVHLFTSGIYTRVGVATLTGSPCVTEIRVQFVSTATGGVETSKLMEKLFVLKVIDLVQ